jgi:hypothetical protein
MRSYLQMVPGPRKSSASLSSFRMRQHALLGMRTSSTMHMMVLLYIILAQGSSTDAQQLQARSLQDCMHAHVHDAVLPAANTYASELLGCNTKAMLCTIVAAELPTRALETLCHRILLKNESLNLKDR